jgi:hypothetical protein
MTKYKIYIKGNYIVIVDTQKNEYFYGIRKEVHIDKSNLNKEVYRAFNVKDFSDTINLQIPNILKEDGSSYTEAEFDTFYQENTGNFNGGGTAPTGDFIPITGTTVGNPVTGDIHSISNFYIDYDNGDPFVSISSTDRVVYLGDAIGNYNNTNIGIDDVQQKVNINAPLGTLISSLGLVSLEIYSTNPLSRGLEGVQDFTANITDLDYTQKIYVDTQSQRTTATSGTVNLDSGKRDLVLIHEAGATTTLTLNLPTSPKNNDKVTIMSVGGIVGLTLATAVGTIIGAVTTLASLGITKLIWNSSQSKWYKIS